MLCKYWVYRAKVKALETIHGAKQDTINIFGAMERNCIAFQITQWESRVNSELMDPF